MTEIRDDLPLDERQDSDYDGAWKEAFRFHLREFLERCFCALAQLIDWTVGPVWLDKEMSQIVGQSGRRNREVDLLFKVRLIDGRDQWILCHLEIQAHYEADFSFRIDLYNSGLKWLFRQEVLTLVILADLNPNWRPTAHHFSLGGFASDRQFPICKLLDRLATDWVGDNSLVVQVARAQIAALQTASDPEARYTAKTQLVRNLYTAGYSASTIRELFRLIDWMMHLRLDLSRKFDAELVDYEKELQMPYVTSIERNAEERGLIKGREEGREEGLEEGLEKGLEKGIEEGSTMLVLRQLKRRCGDLPEEIKHRVRGLSLDQIQSLGESVFDFQSVNDLKNWLTQIKK